MQPPAQLHHTVYAARRQNLSQQLAPGLLILPTAPTRQRNADSEYSYRFDSNFYYLTGFTEPSAVLVQVIGDQAQSILFCQAKNELMEIWQGFVYGPDAAREAFGFDAAFSIEELDAKLLALLANQPRLYFPVGVDAAWDQRLFGLVQQVRAKVRAGITAPDQFIDVRPAIAELRLRKDEHEVALMREAGRISAQAHIRAMQATKAGLMEYEIEAELLHHFYKHGSRAPAYNSIVAGGKNATCLHYGSNNQPLHAGDLLLIDAGCELHGYAADITRTFPVNGKFSKPQRAIYELVLAAMQAAFAAIRPGEPRTGYHDAAVKVLTQGLVDLKILRGSVDGLLESGAYKQFYMHGTGHWLGLDVHDAGAYLVNGAPRPLQAGMTLTVEPGLYFRPGPGVPDKYLHIGVRIEDDVLVTNDGYDNLTALAPKTVSEIEALMAGKT